MANQTLHSPAKGQQIPPSVLIDGAIKQQPDAMPKKGCAPHLRSAEFADATLILSHREYRELAEISKAHAGWPLNLASVEDMGNDWGFINYWAMPTLEDVTQPDQKYSETAYIYLVSQLNTGEVRTAGKRRPECDWSKLRNSEIYQFVVWHEIGHIRDNFHPLRIALALDLPPEAEKAREQLGYVNEILADRFAWERVRPGEPMPLTQEGRENADKIEETIQALSRHFKRAEFPLRSLEAGQYRHVPAHMLSSERKAAFVGPDISPKLLKREIERCQSRFERDGKHMKGVAV
jgi:hypothetical protein